MAKFQNFVEKYIWGKSSAIISQDESRVMDVIVEDWTETYGMPKPVDIDTYGKVYSAEEIVYICVSAIAQSSAKAPLILTKRTVKDGETVYVPETDTENPINKLFTQVNQVTTEEDFKEVTLTSLELQGNSYWWVIKDSLGIPRELFHLRPDWMTIIPDKNGYVKGYVFNNGSKKERFEPEEILHIKYHDPRSYFYGLSPIAACRVTVKSSIYAKQFQKSFFINSARPSGVLRTDQPLNKDEIRRVEKLWKKAHGGPKNAFRTAILQKNLEYQAISLSAKDADFIAQMQNFTERLMGVFKVPPVLGAVYKESHYNNADIQRKIFWEEVLSAKLNKIAGQINEFLIFPIWGEQYRVAFDYSGIEVLQEKENELIDRYKNAVSSGLMTPNEARAKMNLEPLQGGDVTYMPISLVPMDFRASDSADKSLKKKDLNNLAEKLAQTRERGINKVRANFRDALSGMFKDQGDKIARLVEELNNESKAVGQDEAIRKLDEDVLWEKGNLSQMIEDVAFYFTGACMLLGIEVARDLSGVDIPLDLDSPKIVPAREAMLKKLKSLTDKTSKDKLQNILMAGFDEKKTVDQVTREIKTTWKQYSTYRAEAISRTETANAYGEGSYKYYQETGATKKEWLTMGDDNVDDACISNASQGEIGIEEAFNSGVEHEPNHVNCRCSVIYK